MATIKRVLPGLLLLVVLVNPVGSFAQETMHVAFSEFPPFKIVDNGKYEGIDVELLDKIAKRLNFKPTYLYGTFEECLEMMKSGRADIMTNLLWRPEREQYIHYIQPRYRTKEEKWFYVLKGKDIKIVKYDDLGGLRIGVKEGVQYAPMFDTDKNLNKVTSESIERNLRRLVEGKIDTFITSRMEGNYWIQRLGLEDEIEPAVFKFEHSDSVYMGLSKKSPWVKQAGAIGKEIKHIVDSGEIQRLIEKYPR